MKIIKSLLLIFILSIAFIIPINASSKNLHRTTSGNMYVPGMLLIKFTEQNGEVESSSIFSSVIQQYQINKAERLFPDQKYKSSPKKKFHDLSCIFRCYIPESMDVELVCAELSNKSGIAYAEPVYLFKTEEIPNDPRYLNQQYLPQIKAPQAWDVAKGNKSVIIAIIDTGVDWDHPDLAASIWNNADEVLDGSDTDGNGYPDDIRGWDWVDGADNPAVGEDALIADNNPLDFDGHGTHCAGDAAGITNNGVGIASISWNCAIMPLRVGWRTNIGDGLIRMDWVAEAYRYAADNGAHVATLSTGSSYAVADAARYAFEAGVVITKSAGNDNIDQTDPLEEEAFAITVAAVDDRDYKATYSNFGSWVKISAPGGDQSGGRPGILSTVVNDAYAYYQGTSMAAPIVAGFAGLLRSQHPEWSNAEVTFQIINTTDNIDALNPQYAGRLGSGRINAYKAVTEPYIEPSPKIQLVSQSVDDAVNGNGNGIAEAGEELSVLVEFMNSMGNAADVSVNLVIEDWAIDVINGTSYLGAITGLRDLANNRRDNSADPFIFKIDSLALPHRITGMIELSADNGYQQSYDFIFSISPSVLLVDDDELDIEKYYTEALDSLNISYVYWNHDLNGTPPDMAGYSTVIWSCEWTFPTLESLDRSAVMNYLDNGGNLFLSGQDIGFDLCDQTSTSNEYNASQGASLIFYENYLHARYLLDDSEYSVLHGVPEDPIGNGLSFSVFQPNRAVDEQFPSEVTPIHDGISVFNYINQNSGAVRYAGAYRTVYFAFGGYEAITAPDARSIVMQRVLDWLNGIKITHTPLNDTEDTENGYVVMVTVTSEAQAIGKVELFWDMDDGFPFMDKIAMNAKGNGVYEATIPAQDSGTEVQYTIFAQTISGYYSPIIIHSFHVGVDNVAPTFNTVTQIPHSLSKTGPYHLAAVITDNGRMNPEAVYLHYQTKEGVTDSVQMIPADQGNTYEASFYGNYDYGDTVAYYITAQDSANVPNRAESAAYKFIVGWCDFEGGFTEWAADSLWGIEDGDAHSGYYYASDSPYQNYEPGANRSLMLKPALDFSEADSALLSYYTRYKLQPAKAFGYVEASTDSGRNWTIIGTKQTGIRSSWTKIEIPMNYYLGMNDVQVRFHIKSDPAAASNYDGWFIDDIQITTFSGTAVTSDVSKQTMPKDFYLAQNYPNPFNPHTYISYQLASPCVVTIKIYNTTGQLVRTLINEQKPAGMYSIQWDSNDERGMMVSSGLYFYHMKAADFMQTRKMLLMK